MARATDDPRAGSFRPFNAHMDGGLSSIYITSTDRQVGCCAPSTWMGWQARSLARALRAVRGLQRQRRWIVRTTTSSVVALARHAWDKWATAFESLECLVLRSSRERDSPGLEGLFARAEQTRLVSRVQQDPSSTRSPREAAPPEWRSSSKTMYNNYEQRSLASKTHQGDRTSRYDLVAIKLETTHARTHCTIRLQSPLSLESEPTSAAS